VLDGCLSLESHEIKNNVAEFFLCENLLCAPLDPLPYMMLLGSKYAPNMTGEPVVLCECFGLDGKRKRFGRCC
jgi:hypothetical protein